MHRMLALLTAGLLSGITVAASAQATTCASVLVDALNAVNTNCSGQANNTACYGNFHVEAQAAAGAAPTFAQPADRTPLETLASITSLPFDTATQEWGVSVLKVQARGPGVLPGQALTMLLVGDSTLSGIRSQAYTVQAGLGVPSCEGVPPSSLLVQGPRGIAIDLRVNGANIRVGSTMVISTQEEGRLTFATLDGRANIAGLLLPVGYTTSAEIDQDSQIIEDSFSEPVVMTDEERMLYEGYDEFTEEILEYTIDTPDEDELALIDALGLDVAFRVNGHALRDLVDAMLDMGYLPIDFEGASPEDIVAFLTNDSFARSMPDEVFNAFLNSYNDLSDEPTLDDFEGDEECLDDADCLDFQSVDDCSADADADNADCVDVANDCPADDVDCLDTTSVEDDCLNDECDIEVTPASGS